MRFLGDDPCEGADSGCPKHKGADRCQNATENRLYRADTPDETGTAFCEPCASDAFKSGLFDGDPDADLPVRHPRYIGG